LGRYFRKTQYGSKKRDDQKQIYCSRGTDLKKVGGP